MKKINYFIVILLVLLSVSLSYSQPFKAKDGLSTASSNSGISNPELLMCAAVNGYITGLPTDFKFYINYGEANAWFYLFRSADNHNDKKLMMCYYLINLLSFEIPLSSMIDSLPYEPAGSLNDIDWMDSDVMAENLRNSQDYKNYLNAHTDATIRFVTLSYNGDYPYLPIGNAYWMARIEAPNAKSLICAVNAVDGDVTCFDEPSAVDEKVDEKIELKFYPNPSKDYLFVTIPPNISINGNLLELFDSEGKLAYCFNVKPVDGINLISVPIQLLSNGQYFIKLSTSTGILSGQFVIER
ncbi:MAG: T9SS type A sorting domain-containing protein [Bacteroidetes bacterium]|nr:MAG: T9SS type A sorting domain-containing protein [Bacteroidota bacterium]